MSCRVLTTLRTGTKIKEKFQGEGEGSLMHQLAKFKAAGRTYGKPKGIRLDQARGSRRTDNVISLTDNHARPFLALYVKVSTRSYRSSGHFWGVNANQVNALKRKGYPWTCSRP